MRILRRAPILIADDDAATLDGLSEFLGHFGYRVVAARNGQEAMDRLLAGLAPSLLIVDLAMPQLAGEELLKYLQSDPDLRFVPVLLGKSVADIVMEKPVNLVELLTHVQRLTGGSRRKNAELGSPH